MERSLRTSAVKRRSAQKGKPTLHPEERGRDHTLGIRGVDLSPTSTGGKTGAIMGAICVDTAVSKWAGEDDWMKTPNPRGLFITDMMKATKLSAASQKKTKWKIQVKANLLRVLPLSDNLHAGKT